MNKYYRIAKIIDDKTVVINAGENEGIILGTKFYILKEKGEEVIDPETKKSLGNLISIKEEVEAVTVLDHMCICQHFSSSIASTLFSSTKSLFESGIKTLNVDDTEITGGLFVDEPIKVGDKVKLVKEVKTNNYGGEN